MKKYESQKDWILGLIIFTAIILLIYSTYMIIINYNQNNVLFHVPQQKSKLEPNEIGDSVGGILNPLIAFTASILTFLAFYIQYQANKSQREIFNLSIDNEIEKIREEKRLNEKISEKSIDTNLKILKTLVTSMLKYYENSGVRIKYFLEIQNRNPLDSNILNFLTDSSMMYFNKLEFKEIYSSVVFYFNKNYKDSKWEEDFIEVLNLIDFYDKFLIELKGNFKKFSKDKFFKITKVGESLDALMGKILIDEKLSKDPSLIKYFEIVHNINVITNQNIIPEIEFLNNGVNFERLHFEFFPQFITSLKIRFDEDNNKENHYLLEEFSKMNKSLGTEIFQSMNFVGNLRTQYDNYFDDENESYPLNEIKFFLNKIKFN